MLASFEVKTRKAQSTAVIAKVMQQVVDLINQQKLTLSSLDCDADEAVSEQESVFIRFCFALTNDDTVTGDAPSSLLQRAIHGAVDSFGDSTALIVENFADEAFHVPSCQELSRAGYSEIDNDFLEVTDF